MTVHKYILHITDRPLVAMPQGAKPLHVAVQGSSLCLWALVDPAKPKVKRAFRLVGTGTMRQVRATSGRRSCRAGRSCGTCLTRESRSEL